MTALTQTEPQKEVMHKYKFYFERIACLQMVRMTKDFATKSFLPTLQFLRESMLNNDLPGKNNR